jgi:uncharacterized protein DUF6364
MQTKLTLRLEEELIRKAKAWAQSRGISLSQAVAGFFAQLPDERGRSEDRELTPWVRRLTGIAAPKEGPPPTDEELREEYINYLEEKYR